MFLFNLFFNRCHGKLKLKQDNGNRVDFQGIKSYTVYFSIEHGSSQSVAALLIPFRLKSNTNHSGDFVHALQVFYNLGLVGWLYTGEETSMSASGLLFGN